MDHLLSDRPTCLPHGRHTDYSLPGKTAPQRLLSSSSLPSHQQLNQTRISSADPSSLHLDNPRLSLHRIPYHSLHHQLMHLPHNYYSSSDFCHNGHIALADPST